MTDSNGRQDEGDEVRRCDFVFEPEKTDVNAFRTGIEEKWECPHPAEDESDGQKLCIFHLPLDEKSEEDVIENFLQNINIEGSAPKRFVGAIFPGFRLVNQPLNSPDDHPIDLRYATFHGEVSISGSRINQPLYITGSEFKHSLKGVGATFRHPLIGEKVSINGQTDLRNASFQERVMFRESTFNIRTQFSGSTFHSETSFYGCEFHVEEPNPTGKITEAWHRTPLISYNECVFQDGINLNSSIFHDCPILTKITSHGTIHLNDIELTTKYHKYQFTKPEWEMDIQEEKEGHHIANISGEISEIRISMDSVPEPPAIINLEGSVIDSGELNQPENANVYFDFSSASIGDIQFKNMDSGAAWKYLIFSKTDFNGFDFTDYHNGLEEIDFDICKINNPPSYDFFEGYSLQEKETTYLKARLGADSVADYRSSSEFHIHQLDTRRLRLRKERELIAYVAHLSYSFTSRYGEKPGRVIFVFLPVLLVSYWFTQVQPISQTSADVLGILLTLLPPIFSALLVLSSSRYIGN